MARTLLITCGAIAREVVALIRANGWQSRLEVQCLPAELHNRPEKIAPAVREKIRSERHAFESIFIAYADCGSGGLLDAVCAEEGVERIPGDHCYGFFAGAAAFAGMHEEEIGTFYLTDFLAQHFERLMWRGLGLDRHPGLAETYFGNYTRLVYLAQTDNPEWERAARDAAQRLGLRYERRHTGYGELEQTLRGVAERRVIPLRPIS